MNDKAKHNIGNNHSTTMLLCAELACASFAFFTFRFSPLY